MQFVRQFFASLDTLRQLSGHMPVWRPHLSQSVHVYGGTDDLITSLLQPYRCFLLDRPQNAVHLRRKEAKGRKIMILLTEIKYSLLGKKENEIEKSCHDRAMKEQLFNENNLTRRKAKQRTSWMFKAAKKVEDGRSAVKISWGHLRILRVLRTASYRLFFFLFFELSTVCRNIHTT